MSTNSESNSIRYTPKDTFGVWNKTVLVIGTDPWFGPLLSKHRIALELCKHSRVIYLEPLYHVGALLRGVTPRDAYLVAKPYHQEYPKNFSRFIPLRLPKSHKFHIMRRISELLVKTQLRLHRIQPDIIISFSVYFPFLANGKSKFIFYPVDTHGASRDSGAIELLFEAETLAKADLVVAGTETLYHDLKGRTHQLKFLPHGVDVEAIVTGATSSSADELKLVPRPIIGFLGAVNRRLDIPLIEYIGKMRPQWSLIFVGPYEQADFGNGLPKKDLERLRAIPNLRLLGSRPSTHIGAYFSAFDVCIMPYDLKNPYVHFASHKPLQSLAVGTPVVTTCAASDGVLPPCVRVGETPDAFIAAIEQTLLEHNQTAANKAKAFAREHSWKQRVEQLNTWIEKIVS